MNIFIDIETIPTQSSEDQERVLGNLKAPANYKKEEAIDKWLDDNRGAALDKTSFEGGYGEIFCICYALHDDDPIVLKRADMSPEAEKNMLVEFNKAMSEVSTAKHFVGHNVGKFDLKFIYKRMVIHQIQPAFQNPHNDAEWKGTFTDTMHLWAGRDSVKLDDLCYYLGVETPKGELDGSKVWAFVQANLWDEVWDYCAADVVAMRECARRLTFGLL